MAEEQQKTKITPKGFRQSLGIETTRYADQNKRQNDTPILLKRYGDYETKNILAKIAVPDKNGAYGYTNMQNPSSVISYLRPRVTESGRKTAKLMKLKAMAPEIEQSKTLVASSIMSPNDMQEGEFSFTFPGVTALDNDSSLSSEISDVYDTYFNKQLEFGVKCYEWVGHAMYESGAKAIMILPADLQTKIANRSKEDVQRDYALDKSPISGMESFAHFRDNLSLEDNFMLSHRPTTWKSILSGTPEDTIKQIVPSMESLNLRIPNAYSKTKDLRIYESSENEYLSGLEDMVVNMRTKLSKGDMIKISENPEIVRFRLNKDMFAKKKIDNSLDSKYAPKEFIAETLVNLDYSDLELTDGSRPTLIELPTESVIPIFVPGAPSEHLGYFVVLDDNGLPLAYDDATDPDPNDLVANGGGPDDPIDESFGATYGTSNNVVRIFGSANIAQNTENTIFNYFLDRFVKEHLRGLVPESNIELGKFNAIASTMFFRLMHNKRTTLLYVPPRLLHYLAFDYRNDGTGKSKLDDIEFILGLRTTLMVSNILAAANDAINHKKIEFDVGEDVKNLEQIADLIRNIFISKNKISGSTDPSEIMDEIASNAITVVPKNVPGLGSNFNVDVQSVGSQSIRPDDNLLENLSNLLISNLDVPPSALNQLTEVEYSRSLVTMNLFFAKKIGMYQRIVCQFISNLIHDMTRYDTVFQHIVADKLQANVKYSIKERMPKSVADLKRVNPNHYSDLNHMLRAILEGVEVALPKTNIVVDKTQFEEIRNYMDSVDTMASKIFDQELLSNDDQDGQAGLTIMRAKWRKDQLLHYLDRIGSFGMVDVPNIDDILDPESITDFAQSMHNLGVAARKHLDMLQGAGDEAGGFNTSSSSDDFDSGSDDDFDMGDEDEDSKESEDESPEI